MDKPLDEVGALDVLARLSAAEKTLRELADVERRDQGDGVMATAHARAVYLVRVAARQLLSF